MVSPDRHLVGRQREAAGNQGQASGRPYRRFGARPDDSSVDPATEAETIDMLMYDAITSPRRALCVNLKITDTWKNTTFTSRMCTYGSPKARLVPSGHPRQMVVVLGARPLTL